MCYKVSIVTPSFNQGRFIGRTIESVLSQNAGELEYLVFDGGSTDETGEILKGYGDRVRWVMEPDKGQADAVNKGFSAAKGEVIGWLNSDDIYYPGAVPSVCEYFARHPDIDVVYGDANHIDEQDSVLERYPTEPWDFSRLLETCFLCQPAVFLRRKTIERFGMLDVRWQFCLDYEYWIRLAQSGARFGWLRREIAGSRMYRDNKTVGSRIRVHREINMMMRERLGRVPDRWLFNYAHARADGRGIPRHDALRFPAAVAVMSLWAACRWNGRISEAVWTASRQWLGMSARAAFGRFAGQ